MSLRISDLPRTVKVNTNDYMVINVDNKVTSSISAYNFSQYVGQILFDGNIIPDFNIDGGNVVPSPPDGTIDGGDPGDGPSAGVVVIDGGTPFSPGYGPDINGGPVT